MLDFKTIAASVKSSGRPQTMTVRDLIQSIGKERRGKYVSRSLRNKLKFYQLVTEPDFEAVHIDSVISVKQWVQALSTGPLPARKLPLILAPQALTEATNNKETEEDPRDVILTIGQLPSADRKPVFIKRDEPYTKAVTLLLSEETDHLVVSQNERSVEGLITWHSIGKACASRQQPKTAADCMELQPLVVRYNAPLFDTVREITRHGFVLVLSAKNQICGSVTSRDIAEQFVTLSEPFLFLEQIENHLRALLRSAKLGQEAIRELTDPRDEVRKIRVKSVDDLTFGETLRAFENIDIWTKLHLNLDRKTLMERLKKVNDIRNSVMHFHPDGITDEERGILRNTRKMLQNI
jgi:CBS domain